MDPTQRTSGLFGQADPELQAWRNSAVVAVTSSLLLLVTVLVDALVSPRVVVLTVFLALAPLVASAALSPRTTAWFALGAVFFAALSWLWNHGGIQYVVRLADVFLVGAIAVFASAWRVRREHELRTSQRIATIAQQALLPVIPEQIGHVRIGTRYHSATLSAQVGGDFYDFVTDRRRTRLILGDVSGKGIHAVTEAARVIRAFRQYGASESDLLTVARRIDVYVQPFWQHEFYATAVLVEWTDPEDVLSVVCCGHPAPMHVSGGRVTDLPVIANVPLGLGPADELTTHGWANEDRLLLFTDGLIEARDRGGAFLPRTEIDAALQKQGIAAALDAVLAAVEAHAYGFNDDLALLLMARDSSNAMQEDATSPSVLWPAGSRGDPR